MHGVRLSMEGRCVVIHISNLDVYCVFDHLEEEEEEEDTPLEISLTKQLHTIEKYNRKYAASMKSQEKKKRSDVAEITCRAEWEECWWCTF